MNKWKLIDKYEYMNRNLEMWVTTSKILEDLKQLDEPQKVTVPQFVADWYEECKDDFETSLFQCIYELFKKRNDNELTKFEEWIIDCKTEPFQTLVNMRQFGYTAEKEKRYLVKIIGITDYNSYLNYHKGENKWTIESRMETDAIRTEHTHKELEEAGFGWVFDCPGIEIEEVD